MRVRFGCFRLLIVKRLTVLLLKLEPDTKDKTLEKEERKERRGAQERGIPLIDTKSVRRQAEREKRAEQSRERKDTEDGRHRINYTSEEIPVVVVFSHQVDD